MHNESTVNKASEIPAVNKFRDGEKIDEDSPAQLALGAMWNITDDVRVNLGYHHFYDTNVQLPGTAGRRHERVSGRC